MNSEYCLSFDFYKTKRQPLVLVVDSNIDNLGLTTQVLDSCGCSFITATDGDTAVQIATQYQPDLILLELMLPKRDGIELILHFRQNANIPIIVVSSLVTQQYQKLAILAGCNEFIKKPYQIHELEAAVARYVALPSYDFSLEMEGTSLN